MNQHSLAFWCLPTNELPQHLQTTSDGLTAEEAKRRLARYGSNHLKPPKRSDVLTLLLAQFKSPLIPILFVCHRVIIFFT